MRIVLCLVLAFALPACGKNTPSAPDLAGGDLNVTVADMRQIQPPDLAVPLDLTTSPDLTEVDDLTVPPDLRRPPDLVMQGNLCNGKPPCPPPLFCCPRTGTCLQVPCP